MLWEMQGMSCLSIFSDFKEVGWWGANPKRASEYHLSSSLSSSLISDQMGCYYNTSINLTSWMFCWKVLPVVLISCWQSKLFPRVPLLVWIYLQEILCSAPDNLQFQQLLVKPRNISSDRLQHPREAQILKQQLIFVNCCCEDRNSRD